MTIGLGRLVCSERRLQFAFSTSSAFSLSSSTAARRTVQTLIGSYAALRTSTRPPSRPRRRCSASDVDPRGAGGELTPMTNLGVSVAGGAGASGRYGALWRGGIRPDDAHLFAVVAQRADRLGDRRVGVAAVRVDEEQVVAEAASLGPRFDARQVHAAEG